MLLISKTQEREAKLKMREKAKELQRQRMEASKKGIKPSFNSSAGFGNSTGYVPSPTVGESTAVSSEAKVSSYTSAQ